MQGHDALGYVTHCEPGQDVSKLDYQPLFGKEACSSGNEALTELERVAEFETESLSVILDFRYSPRSVTGDSPITGQIPLKFRS